MKKSSGDDNVKARNAGVRLTPGNGTSSMCELLAPSKLVAQTAPTTLPRFSKEITSSNLKWTGTANSYLKRTELHHRKIVVTGEVERFVGQLMRQLVEQTVIANLQ